MARFIFIVFFVSCVRVAHSIRFYNEKMFLQFSGFLNKPTLTIGLQREEQDVST